ncbi:YqaA family protein [Acuticoccus sp.]|uniref:YqaA family protein n=1 Tax=Acuticoccus sp. TaxID=1904378 RepID=UPI003B52353C
MLRALYDRLMRLAASGYATPTLFGWSLAESSFFPIPPDPLLVAMVLARRARWLFYASVCTAASVLGGVLGYYIGIFLFEQVGRPILAFYGHADDFATFAEAFNANGLWIVVGAGFTPFPYKVITIAAGTTGMSLPLFVVASLVGRGGRFFLEAALLYIYGEPIRAFIERRLALVSVVVGVVGVTAVLVLKVL